MILDIEMGTYLKLLNNGIEKLSEMEAQGVTHLNYGLIVLSLSNKKSISEFKKEI